MLPYYLSLGLPASFFIFVVSLIFIGLPLVLIWARRKTFSLGRALLCAASIPIAASISVFIFLYSLSDLFGSNPENQGLLVILGLAAIYILYWAVVLVYGAMSNSKGISLYCLIFWSFAVVFLALAFLLPDQFSTDTSSFGSIPIIIGALFVFQFYPLTELIGEAAIFIFPAIFFVAALVIHVHNHRKTKERLESQDI
jgi:hypothetical protein